MIITRCENCARLTNVEKMTSVTLVVRRPEGLAIANEAMQGVMESLRHVAPPGAVITSSAGEADDIPKSAPIALTTLLCGVCFTGMMADPDGRAPECHVEYIQDDGGDEK